MKTYYRYLIWHGQITKTECKEHSYSWSGRMPCTGVLRCMFCGKPKKEKGGTNG